MNFEHVASACISLVYQLTDIALLLRLQARVWMIHKLGVYATMY